MQQDDSTFKFVQLWNDQPLSTHHDIIVSLNYAFYNYDSPPTCGFCVAFFETLNEKPTAGGPAYSLGYTPSDINDKCNPEGYNGLEAALYGIGFDPNGIFAKKTNMVDGVTHTTTNSICIRDNILNDYAFIKQSDDLLHKHNFTIAQQLTSKNETIIYKQVRILFSRCMSKIEVQVKEDWEREFRTVLDLDLPVLDNKSIKVGVFYTSLDQTSKFILKEFNVAGFPEEIHYRLIGTCFQELSTNSNLVGNKLPAFNDWIVNPSGKNFTLYKFDGEDYKIKKIERSSSDIKVLNYTDNLLYTKIDNNLVIYEYKGNYFLKQNVITLPTNDDITACAGDNDTLVIASSSNKEHYYVYDYIKNSNNIREVGKWKFFQSFNFPLSTGFGTNIEFKNNNLISYSKKNFVVYFERDPNYGFLYKQTLLPPYDYANGFGQSISISEYDEMLIGAPMGNKRTIRDAGQGEVFHYVLSPLSKKWVLVAELGEYFDIDSPAANFGYSVKINKNTAIVGAQARHFIQIVGHQ